MIEVVLTVRVTHYDGPDKFDPHTIADSLMEKLHPTHAQTPFTFDIVDAEDTSYAVVSTDLQHVKEI